jgi:spermidine synthase
VIFFSLLLPFLISFLGSRIQEGSILPRIILYFTSLLAASFIGLQFPLASKIYFADRIKRTGGCVAGLIYGADLFGGFFGGLLGAFILLPILGLRETCWIAAALKASSLFLCCLFAKYAKMEKQN